MTQIIDKVRDEFGVIIGVMLVSGSLDLPWNVTARDQDSIHRTVYTTALPYRDPVTQPLDLPMS